MHLKSTELINDLDDWARLTVGLCYRCSAASVLETIYSTSPLKIDLLTAIFTWIIGVKEASFFAMIKMLYFWWNQQGSKQSHKYLNRNKGHICITSLSVVPSHWHCIVPYASLLVFKGSHIVLNLLLSVFFTNNILTLAVSKLPRNEKSPSSAAFSYCSLKRKQKTQFWKITCCEAMPLSCWKQHRQPSVPPSETASWPPCFSLLQTCRRSNEASVLAIMRNNHNCVCSV